MIAAKRKIERADFGGEHAQWKILKYASAEDHKNGILMGESDFAPNLLTNGGITEINNLIAGVGTPTKFDNAHAYLGVGDSNVAEVATQTALQASTNKLFKAMDATYPQVSGQTITWQATFNASDANWAWNEFGVANTSAGTVLLNRKVSAQSTKVSGQVWVLQLSITFS